jgi:hypothetical protein
VANDEIFYASVWVLSVQWGVTLLGKLECAFPHASICRNAAVYLNVRNDANSRKSFLTCFFSVDLKKYVYFNYLYDHTIMLMRKYIIEIYYNEFTRYARVTLSISLRVTYAITPIFTHYKYIMYYIIRIYHIS